MVWPNSSANSNDLVAVIDDVEHAKISEQQLFTNILTVCQKIPGGASKMISAQSSYANLEWSTFALSSSPASIFEMAKTCGEELTLGQKVRLFDIPVPEPDSGGIFDRLKGNRASKASQSVKLIGRLQSGLIQHHGQLHAEVGQAAHEERSNRGNRTSRASIRQEGGSSTRRDGKGGSLRSLGFSMLSSDWQ